MGGRWWLPPSPGSGESCEYVYARGLSMHQKCSNYALTNLLFGLYRYVWIVDLFITHPSPHPRTPTYPYTPSKCYKLGSVPQLFLLPMFSPLDSHLSLWRSLGVCHSGEVNKSGSNNYHCFIYNSIKRKIYDYLHKDIIQTMFKENATTITPKKEDVT
jgi:hypothetical protein